MRAITPPPFSRLRPRDSWRGSSLQYYREGGYAHYPGTGPMAKVRLYLP